MSSPIRPPAPDRQRPFFLVLLGTALLQAAVATWSGLRSEPLDVDAGRHLFTGAFLFDLIREMPHDPRGFALAYYVRFPAVGILHWPPLFHAVEAASFFLFGIGRLGPQLILGAASVTGVIYAWRAALRLTGSPARSLAAGLLLAGNAMYFYYCRTPAPELLCLVLVLASFDHALAFRENLQARDAGLSLGMLGFALLAKETAVAVAPALALLILGPGKPGKLKSPWVWGTCVVTFAMVGAYFLARQQLVGNRAAEVLTFPRWDRAPVYWDMVRHVAPLTVWGVFLLALAWGGSRRSAVIWVAALGPVALAVCSRFDPPRYMFNALPFVILGACRFAPPFGPRREAVAVTVLLALAGVQTGWTLRDGAPVIRGMEPVARFLNEHPQGASVLVASEYATNLVFEARRESRGFPLVILPATKYVAYTRIDPETRDEVTEPLCRTADEVGGLLDDYGVIYVIVDDPPKLEPAGAYAPIAEYLAGSGAELVRSFPLRDDLQGSSRTLIYARPGDGMMRKDGYDLHMGRLGDRTLTVRPDSTGITRPVRRR